MTDLTSQAAPAAATDAAASDTAKRATTGGGRRGLDLAVGTVTALAVIVGALERLWLLVHTPLFGDTAVVGLMGRQIEHGHVLTFYWDQSYGGVEPYLVAAVNYVVPGALGINLTSVLLSGLAAVVVGCIVTELCSDRRVGWLAGAMAWVWPYAAVWNSTRELGFHFVSLLLGLAMIWMAIRVEHGHTRDSSMLSLGLVAGLGFWASPEVIYFVLPTAIVLVGTLRRWCSVRRLAILGAGALLGALPWLYTNATSGFPSLSTGVAQSQGLGHRFSIFLHDFLPMEFSLKYLFDGSWVGGSTLGKLLFVGGMIIVVASLFGAALLFIRNRKELGLIACGVGVVTFPFLLSANSKVTYWIDDRYGVDLSFLIVIVVFATASMLAREMRGTRPAARHGRWSTPMRTSGVTAALVVTVAVGTLLTLAQSGVNAQFASTSASLHSGFDALFSGWHNPDQNLEASIAEMHRAHIEDAYADYWTAYNIDYLDPSVAVTPSRLDAIRSQSIFATVQHSRQPAWLFSAPAHITGADQAFGYQQGPGTYTESSFTAMLRNRGIGWRVVHLGILDAVIPDRPVDL
jgi:hypothetical protein